MRTTNLLLYIENGKECDIGYASRKVKRDYTIHLYNENNFPLKENENYVWNILGNEFQRNNVRNFFENI